MDPLTHALTGAGLGLIAAHVLPGETGGTVVAALLASQFPDIDIVLTGRNKLSYLKHHRGWSHSLLLAPFFALITALLTKLLIPYGKGSYLFWVAFASLAVHLGLDLLNSYGTRALWPLSSRRIALDLLAIVDPLLIGVFIGGIAIYLKTGKLLFLLLPYLILGCYLILMLILRTFSAIKLSRHFQDNRTVKIFPPLLAGRSWAFIVDSGDEVHLGTVNHFGRLEHDEILRRELDESIIEYSLEQEEVRVLFEFARFPWAGEEEIKGEQIIKWFDLRYRLARKERFVFRFKKEELAERNKENTNREETIIDISQNENGEENR